MFGLTGTMTAAPGRGDELEAHLLQAAEALAEVPACRLYLVSRLPAQPDVVHVAEVWDDEQAHRSSLDLPAVERLIVEAWPIIVDIGDRVELSISGGKGLAMAG